MNENSVRGRSVTSGFGQMVSRCIERRIAVANEAMSTSPNLERHAGALRLAAGQFAGMDNEDPRLVALWNARVAFGWPSNEGAFEVEPGSEQNNVLARVGVDAAPPETNRLIAELVAAALDDVVKVAKAQIANANHERATAVAEARRLAPFEQRATAAEAENIDLTADLRAAREQRAKAEREATYLRSQAGFGDEKEPKSGQKAVEGQAYIYETASGKFKAQPPERPAKSFATLEAAIGYRDEMAVAA